MNISKLTAPTREAKKDREQRAILKLWEAYDMIEDAMARLLVGNAIARLAKRSERPAGASER
jgi:hypothetical protein